LVNSTDASTVLVDYCFLLDDFSITSKNKSWTGYEADYDIDGIQATASPLIYVDIFRLDKVVYLGELVIGELSTIAETLHGVTSTSSEFNNLEQNMADRWALTSDKTYQELVSYAIMIEKNDFLTAKTFISSIINRPSYFIGSVDFNFLELFGYVKDFSTVLDNYSSLSCSLEIEEL
jgi:hypothetical protein